LPEGGWTNVGGDKIWPWPDDLWPSQADGQSWPPPEWEHEAHGLRVTGPRSVRMVSPVWTAQNLRVVRDISLEETGTRVILASRIERVAEAEGTAPDAIPVVPWSVTQMPPPQAVLVDYTPEKPWPYGTHGMTWGSLLEIDRTTLWLPAPGGGAAKIGVTGRALGWWRGDTLLVQRLRDSDAKPAAPRTPYEQAQIFWTEQPGGGATSYVELEFTAPAGGGGNALHPLVVTWELHRLPSLRPRMEAVVAKFKTVLLREDDVVFRVPAP
jgi:hypothetical protein